MSMGSLRYCAFWLIILFSNAVFAGNSLWTTAGPLGGSVFERVFDPNNAQTAYATTHGAVYKTLDAGGTWMRASNGIVATTVYPLPLVLDREAPQVLYTSDSSLRLYRSNDGGGSWQILGTNLDQSFLFQTISDVAGETGALFIGGVSQATTGLPQLFKSDATGKTFVRIGTGLPADARIATITVDPLDPDLYTSAYLAMARRIKHRYFVA